MRGGPKRNFQVFSALDFLAEVTQHIPNKGEHLVRYYGWYSHRQRGIREKSRKAVPDLEFLESEYRESHGEATRELQLVLDPEFL